MSYTEQQPHPTYKGTTHFEVAKKLKIDPEAALCIMARWKPGYVSDGSTNELLPTEEEQNNELWDYIYYFWNLKIPRTRSSTCSRCCAPFDWVADAFFARYRLILVKASRGSSKSSCLTTLSMTEMCCLNARVDVLGASEKQSQVIMDYMNNMDARTTGLWWDSPRAPKGLKDPKTDLVARQTLLPPKGLSNGGTIEALTASHKTVRGRRPSRLRIDELDEGLLHLIKSAQGCPQSDPHNKVKAQIVMASTHQHTDGTFSFYQELVREEEKRAYDEGRKPYAKYYEFCYREVMTTNGGWIDPEEVAQNKATSDPDTWEAEFENSEPSATGRVFKDHQLDFLFDKKFMAPEGFEVIYKGDPDEVIDIPLDEVFPGRQNAKDPRYWLNRIDHVEHFAGADFANDVDWSVFDRLSYNSLDEDPIYYRTGWYRTGRRDSWKEIIEEWDSFVTNYENTGAFHDETGNKLISELVTSQSEGFIFSKPSKKALLDNMIVKVQNKKVKGPFIDWAHREMRFLTKDHLSGKKHLPDSVAAFALACWAIDQTETGEFNGGFVE